MKKKKTVALIYGGRGAESEVSKAGARYVRGLIDRSEYLPVNLFIGKNGVFYLREGGASLPVSLVRNGKQRGVLLNGKIIKIDVAFPLLHGDYGEDGRIQGALDTLGISYVGCGVSAGSLAADKIHTKIIAGSLGIPTLPTVWRRGLTDSTRDMYAFKDEAERKIGYPMFIKPISLGSSVGAFAICEESNFAEAYKSSFSASQDLMIEPYIEKKRELECAYLTIGGKEYLSDAGEIACGGVYSYEEKYSKSSSSRALTSATTSMATKTKLKSYSLRLIKELGIRQLSRIDYLLDGEKIYFNEINTMPGFTRASLYPRLVQAMGIAPFSLINSLIEDTLNDRRI